MKNEIEKKLSKIADIWNYYIWEYRECNKYIKFTEEARTNYFGDILGYFNDTFDVVFEHREANSLSDTFANNISLLQTIYVHQDFIEELLELFKCGINKGNLKKDDNYTINRDLRNELIGHPFRKQKGKFISSTVFSYHPEPGHLEYLRYHVDNDYKFESKSYEISEIVKRHYNFLVTYLDKILNQLKVILLRFISNVEKLEKLVETLDFETLLKVLTIKFESLFGNKTYLYEKNILKSIYKKKNEHKRYKNVIDKFYSDLKSSLKESKSIIIDYYTEVKNNEPTITTKPVFKFVDMTNIKSTSITKKVTERSYHYELGKLSEKKNFDFHFRCMREVYDSNKEAAIELDNMKNNLYNDIEYYCSYYLLRKIIKN
ncbi:hypothetical protein [Tenacibaculum ovolyticum]|uniref:hypothetical protein n=1 Tax=Tenacibaculum ovolyticum TaxID=104270 RepID=UPI003BAD2096